LRDVRPELASRRRHSCDIRGHHRIVGDHRDSAGSDRDCAKRLRPSDPVRSRHAWRRGHVDRNGRVPGRRRLRGDRTGATFDNREAGYANDWLQFAAIGSLELEKISVPTLVAWGTADADVPPAQSELASATVPGAGKLAIEKGTHLALFAHPQAKAAQAQVVEFLKSA
jgi:pimeloyl-ACP methyl ester carboxylesterase